MRERWVKNLKLVTPCWIGVNIAPRAVTPAVEKAFSEIGMEALKEEPNCFVLRTKENWSIPWRNILATLSHAQLAPNAKVGIIAGEERPTAQEIQLHHKSVEETDNISKQMWLVEAIADHRLSCVFQPVIDSAGSVFGYEFLVRGTREDGSTASGGDILYASKVLKVEHLIDRHLHEMAIREFTGRKLAGFLFINLIPGFIQRPEYYFEGLTQAALRHKLSAKRIVLDCTNSENPRDIQQLQSIVKYCHSRGYLVALDDIESTHTAKRILREMHPDFIKIDMRLVQQISNPDVLDTIFRLIDLARPSGCTLIAEGVETEAIRQSLTDAGITLYQGYLFSALEEAGTNLSAAHPKAKKTAKRG